MTTFLNLGKYIVNADHIVSARTLKPEPEREQYDVYSHAKVTVKAKPFRVELTLTSVEKDCYAVGEDLLSAASASQTITVSGELAEHLWGWLEDRADPVIMSTLRTTPAVAG
jgi:hypothetical protein